MALSAAVYQIVKSWKRDFVQLCAFSSCRNYCSELTVQQNTVNPQRLSSGDTVQENTVNPLDLSSDDLSNFTSYFPPTFNFAAYVNKSETLKKLVDLDVNLSKIEKKPHIVTKILKLDFEKHMKDHVIFLSDYVGLDHVGNFISKNPLILCEPLEDLKVRVNYLESKGFNEEQINRILQQNPFWLMFSTIRIDRRLGYFQNKLSLSGQEVRYLTTKQPKLITYNLHNVNCNIFVVKEELGFEDEEVKELVLMKPKILMLNQKNLKERFNYIHNEMQISHKLILNNPEVLFCRTFKIKQRHLFLKKLGRAQYNPKKENYVPIRALVEDTDAEFCKTFAKCNVVDFNLFLKTL